MAHKIPESVLVVIHTPALDVLLIERADKPGYWQSVTGSKDSVDEPPAETARREVREETGFDIAAVGGELRDWQLANVYDIYPHWRHRYAPGVTRNTHTIVVKSDSSDLTMTIENIPSQENPRTGKITALSVLAALRRLTAPLVVGS